MGYARFGFFHSRSHSSEQLMKYKHLPTHTLLLALVLVGALPAAAADKTTRLDIVDRAIAHHGGELFTNSRVRLTVSSRSGSFDIDAKLDGDSFDYRVIERDEDGEEAKVHRRTNDLLSVSIQGKQQSLSKVEATRAESYVNQRMYFLLLPYKLNDPGVYKEDLGLEEWDGRSLQKVRVSFEAGSSDGADSHYMYWFDPETARLVQFAYDYQQGDGLRFRKLIDHRSIGGLLFYDAENYGKNVPDGSLSVDSIDPEYLRNELPLVSTIRLSAIEVDRVH